MFAEIQRSELASSAGSSVLSRSPSPSTRTLLQSRLSALYEQDLVTTQDTQSYSGVGQDDHDDGENAMYAFRLFASGVTGKPTSEAAVEDKDAARKRGTSGTKDTTMDNDTKVVRIRLNSESPDPSGTSPGFIRPRPLSYYLAEVPSPTIASQFGKSAVSGEDVKAWVVKSWPGCALPWRVKHLDAQSHTGLDKSSATRAQVSNKSLRRTRLGKKRRILLRKKAQQAQKANLAREQTKEDREMAEREKRKRLNRAKNVRRRAKEKAKKADTKGSTEPTTSQRQEDG